MNPTTPSDEARKEALNFPNGYVYVIEEAYKGIEEVPTEANSWRVEG